jgi:hypothetical protein
MLGLKTVENRTWKPPADLIGKQIAIHAGARFDKSAGDNFAREIDNAAKNKPDLLESGAVLGFVTVVGVLEPGDKVQGNDATWWKGDCYGWILRNPQPLDKPVKAMGKLGIWYWERD